MKDEQILGYVLGALECSESEQIERQLESDPTLARTVSRIRRQAELLELDEGEPVMVPCGLADRTCRTVWSPMLRVVGVEPAAWGPRSWGLADVLVAVAVSLCAILLIFPAIMNSRHFARILVCQDHMRLFGQGMRDAAERHGGYYFGLPQPGKYSFAGISGPMLLETGFLESPSCLFCPGDPNQEQFLRGFPSMQQIADSSGELLDRYRRQAGGSLAYSFGQRDERTGRVMPIRFQNRDHFAIASDAPRRGVAMADFRPSINHGGNGQNVLTETLSVSYIIGTRIGPDHLYLNRRGIPAAGLNNADAVLGAGSQRPVEMSGFPLSLGR